MDHDDEIRGWIYTRREALSATAASGFALLIGCGGSSSAAATATTGNTEGGTVNLVATPELTEGPFFVDERLNRSDLRTDTDRATVRNGVPLALTLTLYELDGSVGTPLQGAWVDLWQTDAGGSYSDIESEGTGGLTFLRGYQVSDGAGQVRFTTIYPGWYQGRTAHIHFKVRLFSGAQESYEFTSQFFFDDGLTDAVFGRAPYDARGGRTTRNDSDGIYNARQADGTAVGSVLTLDASPSGDGYAASYGIAFDTDAYHASARRPRLHRIRLRDA